LCLQTMLDLGRDEALDALVDGGGDAGIDGLHVGDEIDGEFIVTLIQGKYSNKLQGESAFSANVIARPVGTIGAMVWHARLPKKMHGRGVRHARSIRAEVELEHWPMQDFENPGL